MVLEIHFENIIKILESVYQTCKKNPTNMCIIMENTCPRELLKGSDFKSAPVTSTLPT